MIPENCHAECILVVDKHLLPTYEIQQKDTTKNKV